MFASDDAKVFDEVSGRAVHPVLQLIRLMGLMDRVQVESAFPT